MRILGLIIFVTMLCLLLGQADAEDGANVLDQLGDIFSGRGQTYLGVEAIKDIDLTIPILGIDKIGFKVWTDVMMGRLDDDIRREIRGGGRVRLIF